MSEMPRRRSSYDFCRHSATFRFDVDASITHVHRFSLLIYCSARHCHTQQIIVRDGLVCQLLNVNANEFRSPSSYMVSHEPFPDRSRPMSAWLTCTNGVSPNHFPVIAASETMNHIVDTSPSTKSEGGLNILHEADDDAVIRKESTATAALAK